MPAIATQLPFVREPAARTGRRLFRKLILPVGTVRHPDHGDLHFDAARLSKLRDAYLTGAIDQTPFVLVDADNRHTDDPERFRGEVKGLELTAEGLRATIETSEGGTKLLTDNPNLPVSVRIKQLADGREALAHVAGTFDPVAQRMGPWEPIDASDSAVVRDFSAGGCYISLAMDPQTPTPQTPTTAAGALSEQEVGWFRSLMNRVSGTPAEPTTPPATTAPATTATDPPQITDADLQALIASVEPTAEPAEPGVEPTGEPVAASLSAEDRQTLDLANQRAERAEVRAGTTTISARLDGYIAAGVPPAVVDPIRAHLIGDTAEQKSLAIDFANGREPVVAKALFATLDAAKGTIDFSEKGSEMARIDSEDDKVKQMQKEADELASRYV